MSVNNESLPPSVLSELRTIVTMQTEQLRLIVEQWTKMKEEMLAHHKRVEGTVTSIESTMGQVTTVLQQSDIQLERLEEATLALVELRQPG